MRVSQGAPRALTGWAGPTADRAGGDGEQMDEAPDGSGSPGPVQVARADFGPAAGAGRGGQPGWGGDPVFHDNA